MLGWPDTTTRRLKALRRRAAEQDRCARERGDGPDTARALIEHARTLVGLGRYREALDVGRKTELPARRSWGDASTEYLPAAHHLATALAGNMRSSDARGWIFEALAVRQRTLDCTKTMGSIGATYDYEGVDKKALGWYRQVLAIQKKILGTDHPDYTKTMDPIQSAAGAEFPVETHAVKFAAIGPSGAEVVLFDRDGEARALDARTGRVQHLPSGGLGRAGRDRSPA